MFNRGSVRVLGLLIILGTGAATGAQPVPRAVPGNDNFANAMVFVPGTTVKISDPSAATVEIGEPDPCGSPVYNSVWLTYTPVASGAIYLSMAGTQLIDPLQSEHNTVLAVYNGTSLASLNQIDCSFEAGGYQSELIFPVSTGNTYYIQLTTYYDHDYYTPQSFYQLTSRVTYIFLTPQNFGFESPLDSGGWKLKNGSGDGIICADFTYTEYSGACTFKFIGSVGEASKLVQTVNMPAGMKLRKNGMIFTKLYYRGMDSATIENVKITATQMYGNGTPSTKIIFNLSGQPASGSYVYASGLVPLAHGSLSKVKLQVKHKSTTGVFLLDTFTLYYSAGVPIRESGVMAAPPPAQVQ